MSAPFDSDEATGKGFSVDSSDSLRSECQALLSKGDWLRLSELAKSRLVREHLPEEAAFFEATALFRLNDFDGAQEALARGFAIRPNSTWGGQLEFELLLQLDRKDEAFTRLERLIDETDNESAKTLFVQHAAEHGFFEIAGKVNERRKVIRDIRPHPEFSLCLQVFNKPDTLRIVLDAFLKLRCTREFTLLVIQDNKISTKASRDFSLEHRQVSELVASYLPALSERFFSVEFVGNDINLGTAPTCRRVLDYACARHNGFLFVEDDCVLSPDALEWALHQLRIICANEEHWFFSAESVFFDRQDRNLLPGQLELMTLISQHKLVSDAYVLLDFVPSTCFGTSSKIWRRCNNLRSFPRGPESLSRFLRGRNLQTISPVVPRATDIGMQHSSGYSVSNLGKNNVKEDKNTFLLASRFVPSSCAKYDGDLDELYGATSLLDVERIKILNSKLGLVHC